MHGFIRCRKVVSLTVDSFMTEKRQETSQNLIVLYLVVMKNSNCPYRESSHDLQAHNPPLY